MMKRIPKFRVGKRLLSALKWKKKIPVDEWAEQEYVLEAESAVGGGRFNFRHAPHLREPIRLLGQHHVSNMSLWFASQAGKTTVGMVYLNYFADRIGGVAMFFLPNDNLVPFTATDRILPAIKRTCNKKSLEDAMKQRALRENTKNIRLIGTTIRILGANSPTNRKSTAAKLIIMDEIAEFEHTHVAEIEERGKALALDTPIPTPLGWTTMGELEVGDVIYDNNGKHTTVTFTTGVQYNRDCYKIEFNTKEEIIADADHKWAVEFISSNKKLGGIRTTEEMSLNAKGLPHKAPKYGIRTNAILNNDDADLAIAPYTMGVWLGDGTQHSAVITKGLKDIDCINKGIKEDGYDTELRQYDKRNTNVWQIIIEPDYFFKRKCPRGHEWANMLNKDSKKICKICNDNYIENGRNTIPKFKRFLDVMNTYGLKKETHKNINPDKTIPPVYLRASIKQRTALLQGLMDTDGWAEKDGRCGFCTKYKIFADSFEELVRTFGLKPHKKEFLVKGKTYYTIMFIAYSDLQVFRLKRKQERLKSINNPKIQTYYRDYVKIKNITKIKSVPVKCIQVDSLSHLFLVGKTMIPTHNTFTSFGGKILKTSTSIYDNDPIVQSYKFAECQMEYNIKCYKCGKLHVDDFFKNIRYLKEKEIERPKDMNDEDFNVYWRITAARTASYSCPYCNAIWDNSDFDNAIDKGGWKPNRGNPKSSKTIAFRASSLVSKFVTLEKMVEKWLSIEGNEMLEEKFFNGWLSQIYKPNLKGTDAEELKKLIGSTKRYEVPENTISIVMTIDVQKDHFWYLVRAVDINMARYDIDYGRVETWYDLETLLFRTYNGHFVEVVAIDSGYNSQTVYDFCYDMNHLHESDDPHLENLFAERAGVALNVIPIKGGNRTMTTISQISNIEKDMNGNPYADSQKLHLINVAMFKDTHFLLLKKSLDEEYLGKKVLKFHKEAEDTIFKQYVAEYKQEVVDKRGQVSYEYVKVTSKADNHLLDCSVYAEYLFEKLDVRFRKPDHELPSIIEVIKEQVINPKKRELESDRGGWMDEY